MRVLALAALCVAALASQSRASQQGKHSPNAQAAGPTVPPPTPASVLAAMDLANAYFTGHNSPGDCGWTRGTYYAGSIAHYHAGCSVGGGSGCNATLLSYISSWAASHNYSCGGSINANDEA